MPLLRSLITGLVLAASSATAGDGFRLVTGQTATISVPENVTTGYSWAIDQKASQNLKILSIADLGHASGANRIGAAGTRVWSITALAPGHATLSVVYRRPWERAVAARRSFVFTIAPQ